MPCAELPPVAGLTLDQARAALAERTFTVGKTVTVFAPSVPAGTVVGPTDVRVLTEGSPVDLQIASSDSTVAHSPFTFTVASAPRLQAANRKLAGRTLMTNRARIDVTLDARPYHRIQRWHFRHVGSGAAVVQMKLTYPLKPGMYQLYWKATSDATGTVKRSITSLVIAAPHAKAHIAKPAADRRHRGKASRRGRSARRCTGICRSCRPSRHTSTPPTRTSR